MKVIVTLGDVVALIVSITLIVGIAIAYIVCKIQERIERRKKK